MSVFRISKKENYVVVDKGFVQNQDLSLQAKGLLLVMLSKPNDWEFRIKQLATESKNGRDAHYRIMEELIEAGYVVKDESRGEAGRFGKTSYTVYEKPENQPVTEKQYMDREPHTGNWDTERHTDNPVPEEPETVDPNPVNEDLLSNKEVSNELLNNELLTDDDNKDSGPKKGKPSIYDEFMLAFGKQPSPLQMEKLNMYLAEGVEEGLVTAAIRKAAMAGAHLNYAATVLNNWQREGITNVAEMEEAEKKWAAEKNYKPNRIIRKEPEPDWINKPESDFDPEKLTEEEQEKYKKLLEIQEKYKKKQLG